MLEKTLNIGLMHLFFTRRPIKYSPTHEVGNAQKRMPHQRRRTEFDFEDLGCV